MQKITKQTLIPIGLVVAICGAFFYLGVQLGGLKTEVASQGRDIALIKNFILSKSDLANN